MFEIVKIFFLQRKTKPMTFREEDENKYEKILKNNTIDEDKNN